MEFHSTHCVLDNTKSCLVSLRSKTKYLKIQDRMKLQSYFFFFFLTGSSSISGTDPFKSAWYQSLDLLNICCMWELCSHYPFFLKLLAWVTDVQLNIIYSPAIPIFTIWNYSLNGVIHKFIQLSHSITIRFTRSKHSLYSLQILAFTCCLHTLFLLSNKFQSLFQLYLTHKRK